MKKIEISELARIQGGGFWGGVCGGLTLSTAGVGAAAIAVSYGWMAFVPGLNVAVIVVGVAAGASCGIYAVSTS